MLQELATCDPDFYKHTQRLFLELFERDLAYQAESFVNWDPVDKTVLANEQVDANGCSWRSGAKVEKLRLKQWFLRITSFKEQLYEDLKYLAKDNFWPGRVIAQQRNWIGPSIGTKLHFEVNQDLDETQYPPIEVFTTRLDTLLGVQFLALSLQHPLVARLARNSPELTAFIESASNLPPDSKAGFELPITAKNPLSGIGLDYLQDRIRIFAAPYVLDEYGAGAVMGVPGHDTRDHSFFELNRASDPIRSVVQESDVLAGGHSQSCVPALGEIFTRKGYLTDSCGQFSGLRSEQAEMQIYKHLRKSGEFAEVTQNWRLRDWLISRQRYWGTPIPVIHCDSCGAVPVPVHQLPVELPPLRKGQFQGRGGNPLDQIPEWVNTECPKCSKPAKRETDTMDTFMDSSWYFLRFTDPNNAEEPFSFRKASQLMPVDIYVGGVEHAILHLLYARFISKFVASVNGWPEGWAQQARGEPFHQLVTQGMVHGKTYTDPKTGRFLKPEEVETFPEPEIKATGETPIISYEKMSKSKYNGVDPGLCISKYGADATRAHILFQAPVSEILEWDENRIVGIHRWFNRVWKIVVNVSRWSTEEKVHQTIVPGKNTVADDESLKLRYDTQRLTKSVSEAYDSAYSLNTAVSDLMQLTNQIVTAVDDILSSTEDFEVGLRRKSRSFVSLEVLSECTDTLIRLMQPITPAFAEECWEHIHSAGQPIEQQSGSVLAQPFPKADVKFMEFYKEHNSRRTCAVQIDGKLRFTAVIRPPPDREDQGIFGHEKAKLLEQDRNWVLDQLKETKEYQDYVGRHGDRFVSQAKDVIVVGRGRTVNFVVFKKRDAKKKK